MDWQGNCDHKLAFNNTASIISDQSLLLDFEQIYHFLSLYVDNAKKHSIANMSLYKTIVQLPMENNLLEQKLIDVEEREKSLKA